MQTVLQYQNSVNPCSEAVSCSHALLKKNSNHVDVPSYQSSRRTYCTVQCKHAIISDNMPVCLWFMMSFHPCIHPSIPQTAFDFRLEVNIYVINFPLSHLSKKHSHTHTHKQTNTRRHTHKERQGHCILSTSNSHMQHTHVCVHQHSGTRVRCTRTVSVSAQWLPGQQQCATSLFNQSY